jgi:MoaA/NifB/PqqE/SkfB family radical SAM enzyme
MGWFCKACGNRESFTEYNRVRTSVLQGPDARIKKIINAYDEKPLIEVFCNRCHSRNIGWMEVAQDNRFIFDDDRFVSQNHEISAIVFELTNRCDAECPYCPKSGEAELSVSIIRRILEENRRLVNPIGSFELGWDMGNPLLHKDIVHVLDLFKGLDVNILTNGRDFMSVARGLDLRGFTLTFFLDSPLEKENDESMGHGCYRGTVQALEYLREQKIAANIYMRLNSSNYGQLAEMKSFAESLGADLIPTEIYPIGLAKRGMWMDNLMKEKAIERIDELKLMKTIHYSKATVGSNCSYLRRRRMLIDARGKLSFCHFISSLPNAAIADASSLSLLELIQKNNKARNGFIRNKEARFHAWKKPRETSSPCGYCLHAFGVKEEW